MCFSCGDKNMYTSIRGRLPAGNGNCHFNDEKFIAVIFPIACRCNSQFVFIVLLHLTKRISNKIGYTALVECRTVSQNLARLQATLE